MRLRKSLPQKPYHAADEAPRVDAGAAGPAASAIAPPNWIEGEAPIGSPARLLQQHLDDVWREPLLAPEPPRWSPRATLAFTGGVSAVMWAAIIGVALALR